MIRQLRKFGLVAALATGMMATAAHAVVTIDPDGAGADQPFQLQSLNWNVGNVVSIGGIDAVNDFINSGGAVQTPFETYYHASLGVFNRLSGPVPVNFVTEQYEWTIVVGVTEVVTSVAGNNSATFGLAPGVNFLEIYYDATPDANNLAGTGFNNGTLILSATITDIDTSFVTDFDDIGDLDSSPAPAAAWSGQQSVSGTGATSLEATVDFAHPSFFFTDPNTIINLTLFNTSQILPFNQINPSLSFWDGSGFINPDLGLVNGIDGPDFQFQADGNQSFRTVTTVIPEPATATLGLMSLGAMVFGLRRRRNA